MPPLFLESFFPSKKNFSRHPTPLTLFKNRENPPKIPFSPPSLYNEMRSAERLAIKTMQLQCFPKELKSLQKGERVQNPKFFQLKLYLDRYGIIRIQGRLRDEHFTKTNKPILFGYRHPFTILFILNRHKGYNCSSKDYTLNKVRREIHSFKLRRQIVEIVNKCIICRKNLNKPFRHQGHPPLNDYRTISDRPFSMCGVD